MDQLRLEFEVTGLETGKTTFEFPGNAMAQMVKTEKMKVIDRVEISR